MICSSLVLCLFDYSISAWYGGISKYHAHRLQCAQNKVIRLILNKDHEDFKSLGILNINTRAEQLRLNHHVFNIFYVTCPDYIKENFYRLSNLHLYDTRGSNFNFQVPRIKTHSSGSFYYNVIANWNSLPDDIKSITLKSVFKRSVKTHLLNHMDV